MNLRNKKREECRNSVERPMSWEGELSDSEVTAIKPVSVRPENFFLFLALNKFHF